MSTLEHQITTTMNFRIGEGYCPEQASEDVITVKYEGRPFGIFFDEDDPDFIRIDLLSVWSIDSMTELVFAQRAAHDANAHIKHASCIIEKNRAWVTSHFFSKNMDEFYFFIPRVFSCLNDCMHLFIDKMHEFNQEHTSFEARMRKNADEPAA